MTKEKDFFEIVIENNNTNEVFEIGIDSIAVNYKETKVDIEKGFNYLNPFFLVISIFLIIIFFIQISYGLLISQELDEFTARFANNSGGNIYGIFTSMFLHGSFAHLISNIIFFYIFSLLIYRIFKFSNSIILFLLLGIISGIPGYLLNSIPSIGASGAVFGLFGISTIFYIQYKNELENNLLDLSWVLLLRAGYQIFSGFMNPNIDNIAHISGYIGGLVIGYILFKNRLKKYI